ncbi:flavodoxin family protein [Levilactobacillus fuyuanensis]|uniref:Flavodoxin family protein n=1 Tax=Levilactobacillus fuyuanensis TaxID=2486022 RepID=A0ABW4H1X0_9LACO|nr:NAD(P)H-dependent oxidoreductase [Levilactobacillus fuyuanensis]
MSILFINGSPRRQGNTATLGNRLLTNIPHTTLNLADYQLNFAQDQRETKQPQWDLTDDYEHLMTTYFAPASDIILGTPVYWYGMTGQLKVFMDRWFDSFSHDFPFAGKRIYLLVIGADQPEIKATGITQAVRYSCDWLEMAFCGTGVVTADGPQDVAHFATLPVSCQALRQKIKTNAK